MIRKQDFSIITPPIKGGLKEEDRGLSSSPKNSLQNLKPKGGNGGSKNKKVGN